MAEVIYERKKLLCSWNSRVDCPDVAAFKLLFPGKGAVVCGNNLDLSIHQSFLQSFIVFLGPERRSHYI